MRRRLLAAVLTLAAAAVHADSRPFTGTPMAFKPAVQPKVVGVYVPNWESTAVVDRIQPGSVTHILYAFLRICGPGQLPKDADNCQGKADFQIADGAKEREFNAAFLRLKQREPGVKVLASLGGWGGSDPFFHFANVADKRAVFARAAADFLRRTPGFDGLDIDWEHPGSNGGSNGVQLGDPADGQGYADLMAELRQALDALGRETGRRYLLTSAINAGKALSQRVNYRQAAAHQDLFFLMSYDYYGPWTEKAGNHTGLRESRPGADDGLDAMVRNMRAAGVPAAQLVAGVGMYGRGFSGVSAPGNGVPRRGVHPEGGDDGATIYRVLVKEALGPKGQGVNGWRVVFDKPTQAWNLHHPERQLFIGYDDPRAVKAKGEWAVRQGLAGVFAWELSQDNGDLLNAMNLGVGNKPVKVKKNVK